MPDPGALLTPRSGAARPIGAAIACAAVALTVAGCVRDPRSLFLARRDPPRTPGGVAASTRALCRLIGPASRNPGVYGTDLGFTVPDPAHPGRLAVLFGDTWARTRSGCPYPPLGSDDMQAWLPAARPAGLGGGVTGGAADADCAALELSPGDARATAWQRLRLFEGPSARADDTPVDTTALKTPLSAFSDGTTLFAFYNQHEVVHCTRSRECPEGMACSNDASAGIRPLGVCARAMIDTLAPNPTACRSVIDCHQGQECKPASRGVCIAPDPFTVATSRGPASPSWYRDDPRLGTAYYVDLIARIWPERPTDYAIVHRFVTNRFLNVAARTVAYFDPERPERNDYRPGLHTLLVWGRAGFLSGGGPQNLPFLLYHPLEPLRRNAARPRWEPQFFAGYDGSGGPRWSPRESDAVPIYGADRVTPGAPPRLVFDEPEFDYDNQMTVSWVDPLKRWVMLYGGDVPAFGVRDPRTGDVSEPTHLQRSPGAIHFRVSPHPWGRATRAGPPESGWSSFEPAMTRADAAPYLACGEGGKSLMPGCVASDGSGPAPRASTLGEAASCIGGGLAMSFQLALSGNTIGRLYSPNIIEQWTEEVADPGTGKRGAEIYWNVSTWNPYQVVLMKTRLIEGR